MEYFDFGGKFCCLFPPPPPGASHVIYQTGTITKLFSISASDVCSEGI